MTSEHADDVDEKSPKTDEEYEAEAVKRLKDVDHTHPDTDDSFTDTGVYDRGKKRPTADE